MKAKLLGAALLSSLFVVAAPAMAEDAMSSTDSMQATTDNTATTTPNASGATPPTTPSDSANHANDDMNADTATGDDDY